MSFLDWIWLIPLFPLFGAAAMLLVGKKLDPQTRGGTWPRPFLFRSGQGSDRHFLPRHGAAVVPAFGGGGDRAGRHDVESARGCPVHLGGGTAFPPGERRPGDVQRRLGFSPRPAQLRHDSGGHGRRVPHPRLRHGLHGARWRVLPIFRIFEPVRVLHADAGAGEQLPAVVRGLGRRGPVQLPSDRFLLP